MKAGKNQNYISCWRYFVLYGVVSYGVVSYGVVSYGVVSYGVVSCCMVLCHVNWTVYQRPTYQLAACLSGQK